MIPTIGVMVGAYIIVRMISLATRSGERKENVLVRVLAVLTMVLAMISTTVLFLSSTSSRGMLGFLDPSVNPVQPPAVAPKAPAYALAQTPRFDADKAAEAARAQAAVIGNLRVLKQDILLWELGSARAKFVIQNDNDVAVSDLGIECTFLGPSRTVIDRKSYTIFDTVPPRSKRTFERISLGFVNQQAKWHVCKITAVQARP